MAITKRDPVLEFKAAFLEGVSGLVKAGKIYVDAIDGNPDMQRVFREAIPGYTEGVWRQFEELGRGLMHFDTILSGQYKSKIRRLSLSNQKDIAEGKKCELLLKGGDVIMVDPKEVLSQQAKQIYAEDHIRNIPEQKMWLETNIIISDTQEVPQELPIVCRPGKCIIKRPVILTKKQVQQILMEI